MSTDRKSKLVLPNITVVTVNFNDCDGLARTIDSVTQQDYVNYQYLIVDGESTDGSVDLINSFNDNLFHKIIEHDVGIYHAMNKAIGVSDSEWLLFMNSGDVFVNDSSLSLAMANSTSDYDVIYADWIYANSGKKINADKSKMNVRHQAVVYRRKLHDVYGTYTVSSNLTISDYIFFSSISALRWRYHDVPLSICDENGVSSNVAHFYQRISIDYIFNRRDKFKTIFILIFYPIYRFFKKYYA
jgi:glycosyltransferase involved in cell wall biosynthesis